jgi:hypothetical protein
MILNKYSEKLVKFVSKYNRNINVNYDDTPIIKQLSIQYTDAKIIPLNLKSTSHISKVADKEDDPIVYKMFKVAHKHNLLQSLLGNLLSVPDVSTIQSFVEWYRQNSQNVDVVAMEKEIIKIVPSYVPKITVKQSERYYLNTKLYTNGYISLDVQHHIESENLMYEEYEGKDISIKLFTIDGKSKPDIDMITKIISFVRSASGVSYTVNLTIIYGFQRKELPEFDVLCCDTINSGSTYPTHEITIWRAEEFYKVLVHELVHYHEIEFSRRQPIFNELDAFVRSHIDYDNNDSIAESYTEIVAITLHTIMMSHMLKKSFSELMTLEIKYSLFQIGKIIVFFGGEEFDDIWKDTIDHIIIKQTTSVCSYFIVKTFLLMMYDNVISFWNDSGIKITLENQEQCKELYVNAFNEIKGSGLLFVDNFIDLINSDAMINDIFVRNTMRMSCLQQL